MKIMIVTPYFYPKIGGLENYALSIAKGLISEHKYDVFVVTANHIGKKRDSIYVDGIRVIRLPILVKFSNTPFHPLWYFWIKKIIKIENPTIINAHSPVPGMSDIAIMASGRTPSVLTYHAATLSKPGSTVFNIVARVYEIIQMSTFRKTDSIIAVSDYVKTRLPYNFQHKVSVIYNGIDHTVVLPKTIKKHKHRLIFISSLDKTHEWKGLYNVLDAIKIAKKEIKNIELIVLGDGNIRNAYENRANELKINENVKFYGNITGLAKLKLISSSKALIVYPTTENDAFPTVILEAWLCNTIVVASKIGALPQIIKNNYGELVTPNKPDELAKKIITIFANKIPKKSPVNSKYIVETKYNWHESSKNTANLYTSLLSKSRYSVTRKKIAVIGNMDGFANSRKPLAICKMLKKLGHEVEIIDTSSISRASQKGIYLGNGKAASNVGYNYMIVDLNDENSIYDSHQWDGWSEYHG